MEARQASNPTFPVAELLSRTAQAARAILDRSLPPRGGRPLPRLADTHPAASQAVSRWHGLDAVPVSEIVGTASFQPGTRGTDFRPTDGYVPADWKSRWRRLEAAARDLTPLPPIELVKAGDGYWVVDGHNRVAIAKATGQLWIDAVVTELLLARACTATPVSNGGMN